MTKRSAPKTHAGDIFEVALDHGELAYGRVLDGREYVFYEGTFPARIFPGEILKLPVAFRIWVMDFGFKSGRWPIVANAPLETELLKPAQYFMQDVISGEFSIYDPKRPRPATYEQCVNLENAAGWSAENVEQRLMDRAAGRPNRSVETLKARPNG